jgi:hypothetical protein
MPMAKEDEIPPADNLENDDVLEEQVDSAAITSEEEGFIKGYNEDIEPDKSDEEGLDEDEKIEDA